MPSELVTVNLTRENENEEWGFELAGGGRDKNVRLYIEQIRPGSIAEKVGLKAKDSLVKIGNDCALDYTIDEALESLKRGKDFFDMIVEREAPDVVLQQLVVEDPRYDGLKKEDRGKVGLNDVSKPTLRKDWNCPWIRRDGKGIKRVVRYIDQVPAPIKTSQNHFYSEPGSILAPDAPPMAPEELEQLIQERMGLIEQEEAAKREAMAPKKNETSMAPQPMQEERFEQNKMEVEFSHQQQQLQMQQQHQQQQNIEMHSEENGPGEVGLETLQPAKITNTIEDIDVEEVKTAIKMVETALDLFMKHDVNEERSEKVVTQVQKALQCYKQLLNK